MNELSRLAEDLVFACRRAYTRGIQTGSGGNVSARVPGKNEMLVKASGSSFGDSTSDGFVVTDFEGAYIYGIGKPTREALLHGYLYSLNPNIHAVVHVHAPYSVIWSSAHETLPRITWQARLKMPLDIPVLDIPAPMVRKEDFPLIKATLENSPGIPAFILKDHGIVAFAENPVNAEHAAELIEETAQIAFFEQLQRKLAL
ncbi:MAG: class II aldolase/adducin family protein [Treponema sp.]|jgi:ribulose-5-phosphate 4-epimerase/fuculose-1-phosphate aldolase|nr:class II aldolase/adducin family protein [Treponema sp.]